MLRRIARDGNEYTWTEFLHYYGYKVAAERWLEALQTEALHTDDTIQCQSSARASSVAKPAQSTQVDLNDAAAQPSSAAKRVEPTLDATIISARRQPTILAAQYAAPDEQERQAQSALRATEVDLVPAAQPMPPAAEAEVELSTNPPPNETPEAHTQPSYVRSKEMPKPTPSRVTPIWCPTPKAPRPGIVPGVNVPPRQQEFVTRGPDGQLLRVNFDRGKYEVEPSAIPAGSPSQAPKGRLVATNRGPPAKDPPPPLPEGEPSYVAQAPPFPQCELRLAEPSSVPASISRNKIPKQISTQALPPAEPREADINVAAAGPSSVANPAASSRAAASSLMRMQVAAAIKLLSTSVGATLTMEELCARPGGIVLRPILESALAAQEIDTLNAQQMLAALDEFAQFADAHDTLREWCTDGETSGPAPAASLTTAGQTKLLTACTPTAAPARIVGEPVAAIPEESHIVAYHPAPSRILLKPEDVTRKPAQSRRELHERMRQELQRISAANPLRPNNLVVELQEDVPWQAYIASHKDAEAIIGTGIVRFTAQFTSGIEDPNRNGQFRLDFIAELANGNHWRLHPGKKPGNDAKPVLVQAGVAKPSTEPAGHSIARRVFDSWHLWDASSVPQHTLMGKKQAWQQLTSIMSTAAEPTLDVSDGEAFPWWLWVSNLGRHTLDVIGPGIYAASCTQHQAFEVTLRFTRIDETVVCVRLQDRPERDLKIAVIGDL